MTSCPDTGELRAALDGEADVDAHLDECARCRDETGRLRRNAAVASSAIATLTAAGAPGSGPAATPRRARSWAGPLAAAASLVLAIVLVVTPGGRSAAAAFLSAFRTERLAVVTVDPQRVEEAFAALDTFAIVSGEPAQAQTVADLAEAAEVTGIQATPLDPAALPSLAQGITPEIQAVPASDVRISLTRDRAPDLPEHLDGATLVVHFPAAVVQAYQAADEQQGLVVAESQQLTVDAEGGATLEEIREYLLSRPEVPPELAEQLRSLGNWETTLPIPVPAGEITWRDTTVAGGPGLLFGDNSGLGSVVVWQRDGRIHGVGGTLPAEEVNRLADRLG